MASKLESLEKQVKKGNPGKSTPGSKVTREFGERRNAEGKLITCFICGKKGHFQSECPEAVVEDEEE